LGDACWQKVRSRQRGAAEAAEDLERHVRWLGHDWEFVQPFPVVALLDAGLFRLHAVHGYAQKTVGLPARGAFAPSVHLHGRQR